MAVDLYVQSKFNENVWIRRDDINGDEDMIYNCQVRNSTTLPLDSGRFALGCELLLVENGLEYNNISSGLIPTWKQVGTTYTFQNGITETAGVVELGGELINDETLIYSTVDNRSILFQGQTDGTLGEQSFGVMNDFASGKQSVYLHGNLGFGDGIMSAMHDGTFTELLFHLLGDQSGSGGNEYSQALGYINQATGARVTSEHNGDDLRFDVGVSDGVYDVDMNLQLDRFRVGGQTNTVIYSDLVNHRTGIMTSSPEYTFDVNADNPTNTNYTGTRTRINTTAGTLTEGMTLSATPLGMPGHIIQDGNYGETNKQFSFFGDLNNYLGNGVEVGELKFFGKYLGAGDQVGIEFLNTETGLARWREWSGTPGTYTETTPGGLFYIDSNGFSAVSVSKKAIIGARNFSTGVLHQLIANTDGLIADADTFDIESNLRLKEGFARNVTVVNSAANYYATVEDEYLTANLDPNYSLYLPGTNATIVPSNGQQFEVYNYGSENLHIQVESGFGSIQSRPRIGNMPISALEYYIAPGDSAVFVWEGSTYIVKSTSNDVFEFPTDGSASQSFEVAGRYTVIGDTNALTKTIDISAIQSTARDGEYQEITVEDKTGSAGTYAITVTVKGGTGNINGQGEYVIASDHGSVTLFTYNGSNFFVKSEDDNFVGGNLISTQTQTLASTTAMQTVTLNGGTDIKGITNSNGEITVKSAGQYRFTLVPEIQNTGGGVETAYFQFAVDQGMGWTPMANSSVLKKVPSSSGSDITTTTLNGSIYLNVGDKIRFEWGATSTNVQLPYTNNSSSGITGLTNTPSVIVEFNKEGNSN